MKQKIFLNLFISTAVLLPFVIGANFLAIGWAISSTNTLFLGCVSLLISLGCFLNRAIFHLDAISKQVYEEIYNQKLKEQKERISILNKKLCRTKDEKDEELLKQLKVVYEGFAEDVRNNKISQFLSPSTSSEIDLIFENCIRKLEHSYDLYQTSRTLNGKVKDELDKQRQETLIKIEEDIEHFTDTVSRIRALRLKGSVDDHAEVKRRLNIQLKAAERTQIEMERVQNPDDLTRFNEFKDS